MAYLNPDLEREIILIHFLEPDEVEGEVNGSGVRGAAQPVLLHVVRKDVTSFFVRLVATVVMAVAARAERHAVTVAARELIL